MYATALVGAFQHEADHCVACIEQQNAFEF